MNIFNSRQFYLVCILYIYIYIVIDNNCHSNTIYNIVVLRRYINIYLCFNKRIFFKETIYFDNNNFKKALNFQL